MFRRPLWTGLSQMEKHCCFKLNRSILKQALKQPSKLLRRCQALGSLRQCAVWNIRACIVLTCYLPFTKYTCRFGLRVVCKSRKQRGAPWRGLQRGKNDAIDAVRIAEYARGGVP